MFLLLVVTGCLESPPEGASGDDGGSTSDAAAPCSAFVQDSFIAPPLDGDVWLAQSFGSGSATIVDGQLKMQAVGNELTEYSLASLESRERAPLADTHVVAALSFEDDRFAPADAGVAWFNFPFEDYYTVFVRDGELRAAYELDNGGEISLCGDECIPYTDGKDVTARMSATTESVQLSVSLDGVTFVDFDPAPNSGNAYSLRFGALAYPPTEIGLKSSGVAWYACPPSEPR